MPMLMPTPTHPWSGGVGGGVGGGGGGGDISIITRGPRATHLSDIATADMQMLCNIFPILSSQLMKRSSFKQFFILKKKIYGMPVNGA